MPWAAPTSPGVHNGRRQARSCKIAKSNARLETSQFRAHWRPILAHARQTGDPQGQVRPPGGPAALLEAPARGPILAGWGAPVTSGQKTGTPRPEPMRRANSTAQDHRNTAKLERHPTTLTLVNVDTRLTT